MMARVLVAITSFLLTVAPQVPGPSGQTRAPAGTGAITGTVTVVGTGRPIRGASLTLDGKSLATGGSGAGPGRAATLNAVSDAQGRFSFTGLPPGRFLLDAIGDQYLAASYGQKKPGKMGTPIDLADGQRLDLQVVMTRGSAITGTVFDEAGDPLMHARVRALRYLINQNGVRRLRVVNEVQTDDRGIYRFFNLDPGDYLVSATPLFLDPGAPGRLVIEYAPTYYPVSTAAARATTVSVDGIAEQIGIDIHVLPVPTSTIRGTALGMPTSGVSVQVLLHNTDAAEEPTTLTATVKAGGEFTLSNIAPGQYIVFAQTLPASQQSPGAPPPPPSVVNGVPVSGVQLVRMASFDRLHGRAAVIVDGPNTPPVSIMLQPGRSISGRVVLELTQPVSPAAAKAGTTISITPAPQPAGLPAFNTSPQVQVDADGNFTLPGIRPGRYFLRANGPGTVKSVMWNGSDTLDFPLEVSPDSDVSGVVITLTDRQSDLSGVVTDAAGKPAYGYTVLAVATDRRYWVPGSRRVAPARLAADGGYNFRGLPAGEYRLAVVADFDTANQFDANFLQQLAGTSETVTVAAGAKQVQNLRAGR